MHTRAQRTYADSNSAHARNYTYNVAKDGLAETSARGYQKWFTDCTAHFSTLLKATVKSYRNFFLSVCNYRSVWVSSRSK